MNKESKKNIPEVNENKTKKMCGDAGDRPWFIHYVDKVKNKQDRKK